MWDTQDSKRERDAIPVLDAYWKPNPDFADHWLLFVWCNHCRDWHMHGGEAGRTNQGHRGAHCYRPGSPYVRTGYCLRVVGPMTEEIRRRHKSRR